MQTEYWYKHCATNFGPTLHDTSIIKKNDTLKNPKHLSRYFLSRTYQIQKCKMQGCIRTETVYK